MGLEPAGHAGNDPAMIPGWLVPLLLILLSLCLIGIGLRLRRRRRHAQPEAQSDTPEAPAPDTPEDADELPPEIQAVRAALAEPDAENRKEAAAPVAEEPSGEERHEVETSEAQVEVPPEPDQPPEVTGTDTPETPPPAEDPEPAPEPAEAEESAPDTPADPDQPAPAEEDPAERDEDGRLVLAIAMGDEVQPVGQPRRIVLEVGKRVRLPVVRGFRPKRERLVLRYDGPDAEDVVILPTVEDTWQVNLGGRPVIQVACRAGPRALARALSVNP